MMDNAVYIAAIVVAILVTVYAVQRRRFNRFIDERLSQLCHELGMPDVPFDRDGAVRQVIAGTRPGIPRDGQWWVAGGIGEFARPSRTRLLFEEAAPNREAVQASVIDLFVRFGGTSPTVPGLPGIAESRLLSPMNNIHRDVLIARITGESRPLEAWLVAVPPHLIGSDRGR